MADTDHYLEVRGIKTFCHVLGNGPPLIFIHGHRADAMRWNGFIYKLAERFKVYAPDLPGYGKTQPLRVEHSMKNYAEFILELIEALAVKKPIIFGGSMGGIIAIETALKDETKIKKLVLFGTPISKKFYKFSPAKLRLLTIFAKNVAANGFVCKVLQRLVNSRFWYPVLRLFLLSSVNNPRIIKYETERWRSCSMKIWGETLYESLSFNLAEQVKTPTLVIFSTGDKYIEVDETLKVYQKFFENSEVVKVDLKTHLPKGPVREEFLDNFREAFARI